MTRDDARRTHIAYDVSEDKRRSRLANKLQTYGDRVQYSVFVIDVSPAKLRRLRSEVSEIIDAKEDSVLFCDLGLVSTVQDGRFDYIGRTRPITDSSIIVSDSREYFFAAENRVSARPIEEPDQVPFRGECRALVN